MNIIELVVNNDIIYNSIRCIHIFPSLKFILVSPILYIRLISYVQQTWSLYITVMLGAVIYHLTTWTAWLLPRGVLGQKTTLSSQFTKRFHLKIENLILEISFSVMILVYKKNKYLAQYKIEPIQGTLKKKTGLSIERVPIYFIIRLT